MELWNYYRLQHKDKEMKLAFARAEIENGLMSRVLNEWRSVAEKTKQWRLNNLKKRVSHEKR
jgi:hypothetical protein